MRTLVSLALSLALTVAAVAPVVAVLVDTAPDQELVDLDSTIDLRARIEPMLATIEVATDRIADGSGSDTPWLSIRDAAREGLAMTLDSAVRECSKDYWAMTYASFGLYYLATTRMLDTDEPERAYNELATAMETTNLSESAYKRAIHDCGVQLGLRAESTVSTRPAPTI